MIEIHSSDVNLYVELMYYEADYVVRFTLVAHHVENTSLVLDLDPLSTNVECRNARLFSYVFDSISLNGMKIFNS